MQKNGGKNYLLLGPTSYLQYNSFYYGRSSIKTPQGSLFVLNTFEGSLIEMGGLFERRAYLIQQRQWYQFSIKRGKAQYKKSKVMLLTIKNKSELPAGEQTILDQSTQSFTVMIDQQYHLLVSNNEREGRGSLKRGALLTFFPLKQRAYL